MAPSLTHIGSYKLLESMGRGGLGVLYRGVDEQFEEREVTIEIVSWEAFGDAHEEARVQFLDHTRTAARLQHRNIVTIFGFGEVPDAGYIVMERIRGVTLADRMATPPPLDLDRKLDIVTEICTGLEFAHGNGVIHGDVRPGNVWLGDDGSVKLLALGGARAAAFGETHSERLLGTLSYLAPEQLRALAVDERSDIYSVSAMLFELLTGRRPSQSDPTAITVVQGQPEILNLAGLGVPRGLSALVARGLEPDPDARHQTAADSAIELQAIRLELHPATTIIAKPVSRPEPDELLLRPLTPSTPTPAPLPPPSAVTRLWKPALAMVVVAVVSVVAARSLGTSEGGVEAPAVPTSVPPPTTTPAPATATTRRLDVTSSPAGATIQVNGKATGLETPAAISWTGESTPLVSVARPGFRPKERRPTKADLTAGRLEFALEADLPVPLVRLIASGPYEFEIRSGDDVISPRALAHDVQVKAGQPLTFVNHELFLDWPVPKNRAAGASLQPPELGRLTVTVPPGASYRRCPVFVDGRLFGEPGVTKSVAAGTHHVELRCDASVPVIFRGEDVKVNAAEEKQMRVGG